MKYIILVFFVASVFICPSSHGAMQALSNESLSRVKGSDGKTSAPDPAAKKPETALEMEQPASVESRSSLGCRLKTLHESSEYKKFDFYLNKLERFSDEQDYPHLATSDKFIYFSSCFAETAKKCREKLAQLVNQYHGDHLASMLNEKHVISCKAEDFYNHLMRYNKGTAPLPDLKALISDIKQCQHSFDSLLSNINCEL